MRVFVVLASVLFAVTACSSSDSSSSSSSGSTGGTSGSGTAACPTVSGNWKVTQHCDPSLVGSPIVVTQNGCTLAFSAPFDKFSATVKSDSSLTVTGPQTCTGTASASAIDMSCTPGTCTVVLGH
jgi:hypothetical protein